MKITITDISEMRNHGRELYDAGTSPTHDFDGRADERSKTKFIRDRIEGKVGECAFAKLCRKLGYEATVDYDIYESRSETDDGDLKTIDGTPPATEFDVKTTKQDNLWLAIRESIYDAHDATDPFVLALRPDDVTTPPFVIDLVGWVEKRDIETRIARGEQMHLPWDSSHKIGPQMKTDNWVIPIDNVPRATEDDWDEFIESRLC